MDQHRTRRLFFALWPEETCRQQLLQFQRGLALVGERARYVPAANLHITLHFIGNVSEARLSCFRQQARKVVATGFTLELDEPGYFKKPRVSWLGCSQFPEGLLELHQSLGERLEVCGFQVEKRHYNPHVTMVRKQQSRPIDVKAGPIDWQVSDFVLVESVSVSAGVRYDILERYSLN